MKALATWNGLTRPVYAGAGAGVKQLETSHQFGGFPIMKIAIVHLPAQLFQK